MGKKSYKVKLEFVGLLGFFALDNGMLTSVTDSRDTKDIIKWFASGKDHHKAKFKDVKKFLIHGTMVDYHHKNVYAVENTTGAEGGKYNKVYRVLSGFNI